MFQAKRTTCASFGNVEVLEVEKCSVGKNCVLGKLSKEVLDYARAQCRVGEFLAIGVRLPANGDDDDGGGGGGGRVGGDDGGDNDGGGDDGGGDGGGGGDVGGGGGDGW